MWKRKLQINGTRSSRRNRKALAEKTEVLSDDLLQVEKRLELVKQVSHSTHKKLTACLQGQQGVEVEKKSVRSPSKKLPLTTLAQCMVEGRGGARRRVPTREDAEALRRDAGETGSRAHLVRAHHREGRRGASVRPSRGGNPKHPETKETFSQAGAGHGLSAHTVLSVQQVFRTVQ
ncbi:hypothetical protein OYC64_001962 [Pagothenia borchgrevinki]|uniref:BAR domain-containing protein n=1 Tax=Pagothenia borchgrevinki TaxID=8213 RepID=A0ABD2GDL8_PAGBO